MLAERRSEAVRQFLLSLGTRADQIAGIKCRENPTGPCRAGATECQRQDRSARLYLAEPAESLKRDKSEKPELGLEKPKITQKQFARTGNACGISKNGR